MSNSRILQLRLWTHRSSSRAQFIIGVHQEYPPRGPCCTHARTHTQVPPLRSSACPTYFTEQCKPRQQTAYHCHFITTAQIQSTRLYEAFFAFLMPHTSQYTSKWVANGQQHHVQICYTEFHRNPTWSIEISERTSLAARSKQWLSLRRFSQNTYWLTFLWRYPLQNCT